MRTQKILIFFFQQLLKEKLQISAAERRIANRLSGRRLHTQRIDIGRRSRPAPEKRSFSTTA